MDTNGQHTSSICHRTNLEIGLEVNEVHNFGEGDNQQTVVKYWNPEKRVFEIFLFDNASATRCEKFKKSEIEGEVKIDGKWHPLGVLR